MSLSEVIDCSTRKAADAISRPDLGRLLADCEADISILKLEQGNYRFSDVDNEVIESDQCLKPVAVVKAGVYRRLTGT